MKAAVAPHWADPAAVETTPTYGEIYESGPLVHMTDYARRHTISF